MEKLDGKTFDVIRDNIEKLKELFPETIADGKVDFEKLQQILGEQVEKSKERYDFTWNGKSEAIQLAQKQTTGTLRPCKEESLNWDTTQNLYIEGDNLEILRTLQYSYRNKVQIIYIDPPYNTGNDFIYKDDYKENLKDFKKENELRMHSNPKTSGRYHTNWLNFMYPRLKVARQFLKEDGVIFISIDDDEYENLKKVANEVFGENNYIATLVWEKKKKGAFLNSNYTSVKEYILVFCKNINEFDGLIGEINFGEETYPCIKTTNKRGIRRIPAGIDSLYREENHVVSAGTRISSGNMELILLDELVIENKKLKFPVRIESNWIYNQDSIDEYANNKSLYITRDLYLRRRVKEKREKKIKDLLPRVGTSGEAGTEFIVNENLFYDGWGTNEDGNDELHKLLGVQNLFDFPKPSKLISKLLYTVKEDDCIIMDFFSGSGTTAHSVMNLNAQTNGNRRYILVQLPETIEEDNDAYMNGYNTLTSLGKERIRKAGNKIIEDYKDKKELNKLDTGFKVFKLDETNLNTWNGNCESGIEQNLLELVEPLKEGRTQEDVVYEILLKYGVDLNAPIEEKEILNKKVYDVGMGYLLICLEKELELKAIEAIAKIKPIRVVFYDEGFKDDTVRTNAQQILKRYGVEDIRVI